MSVVAKRGFVIHHDRGGDFTLGLEAKPHRACERYWNGIKDFHADKFGEKWRATTVYSFGMCPHGVRFVGCGWNMNQAANGTDRVGEYDGRDADWYTVLCFVAGPEGASGPMLTGLQDLLLDGRDTGRCGRAVLPHNAFKVKECPGEHLTALAATWHNQPIIVPSEEDPMLFNEGEAIMHVVASYADIVGRSPQPGDADWPYVESHAKQLVADPKHYFRLQALLVKELRLRGTTVR